MSARAPRPDRYGKAALIAGASEGLGAAFARELAASGFDLLLVDTRDPSALARELSAASAVQARALVVDLGAAGAAETIAREAAGWEVGLVVYNAAAAPLGAFLATPLAESLRALDVNNRAVLEVLARLLPPMVARGRGGVLLVGSNAGLVGHPLAAVYGASKAFLVRLGEALHAELTPRGVDVVVACPGAVATPGFFRSGAKLSSSLTASPEAVAREALAALGGPRPVVSLGRLNRATMALLRALPRATAVRLLGRVMRATYAGVLPRR